MRTLRHSSGILNDAAVAEHAEAQGPFDTAVAEHVEAQGPFDTAQGS